MKPTKIYLALIFPLILGLHGCATKPPTPSMPTVTAGMSNQELWQYNRKNLQAIDKWKLTGRIGVNTAGQGGSANIVWQQEQQDFTINLFGPFGAKPVLINGNQRLVVITDDSGERTISSDPEQYLMQQTGWKLPLRNLQFWALGLPAPDSDFSYNLNSNGYIEKLEQDNWKITYDSYNNFGRLQTPKKIVLSNRQYKVKLAISTWVF